MVMPYQIFLSKRAEKDKTFLKQAGLEKKTKKLLELLAKDPFAYPPSYEKLIGDFKGSYSRRINIQHRLVYEVDETAHIVYVIMMWSHYE
jgi:Txe/YoeB family toxin of toxin-antitoxin system